MTGTSQSLLDDGGHVVSGGPEQLSATLAEVLI
jgi:hypothetical protein